ncbi:MAG: A/G-specific adenine glycosylase [Clostridiales bacterium]|nr:A/G-specific adenine glycosylase [Clostridiales bacterium]
MIQKPMIDLSAPLLAWFDENKREFPWRGAMDAYAVWVSETMLQQTRTGAVLAYFPRFMEAYPTVFDLANSKEDELLRVWQGLGYYSRARNMRRAAKQIVEEYGGIFPREISELKKLRGVGEYTAGAVASIAFGAHVPAVDGNALRVFARLTNCADDIADPKTKAGLSAAITAGLPARAGDFNQAVMDLGATVCLPGKAPRCEECPLSRLCEANRAGTASSLPYKSPKKPRRPETLTVFVLQKDNSFLVQKRNENGLLASLYQLPNTTGHLNAEEMASHLQALGISPRSEILCYERKHIFTHIEWHMRVYACRVTDSAPADYILYNGTQSLPTAFRICLPGMTEHITK